MALGSMGFWGPWWLWGPHHPPGTKSLPPGAFVDGGGGHLWGGFLGPLVAFGVPDGFGDSKVLAEQIQVLLGTWWLWDPGDFGVPGDSGDPNVPLGSTPGLLVALGPRWLWDPVGLGSLMALGTPRSWQIRSRWLWGHGGFGIQGFWGP